MPKPPFPQPGGNSRHDSKDGGARHALSAQPVHSRRSNTPNELKPALNANLALRSVGYPPVCLVRPRSILLHQCLHDRILEIAVEFAVGIVGLYHENANDFLLWVHPKMRTKGPVPTITAIGNAILRSDRVAHHLNTQSEAAAFWQSRQHVCR